MTKYRCPQCGSSEGLYVRTDARWFPESGLWLPVECGFEEGVDCTECDHIGPIAEYEVEE